MIKSNKVIKINKHFRMQHSISRITPNVIKDKDIYAMFSGLFSVMQTYATNLAKKETQHDKNSYNHLLKLYLNAVKNMNKYKSLYFQSINENKIINY